jgi:hypothetical protein
MEPVKNSIRMAAGYEGTCQGSQTEIAPGVFGDVKELGEAVRNAEAMGVAGIKVELKRFVNGVEV